MTREAPQHQIGLISDLETRFGRKNSIFLGKKFLGPFPKTGEKRKRKKLLQTELYGVSLSETKV